MQVWWLTCLVEASLCHVWDCFGTHILHDLACTVSNLLGIHLGWLDCCPIAGFLYGLYCSCFLGLEETPFRDDILVRLICFGTQMYCCSLWAWYSFFGTHLWTICVCTRLSYWFCLDGLLPVWRDKFGSFKELFWRLELFFGTHICACPSCVFTNLLSTHCLCGVVSLILWLWVDWLVEKLVVFCAWVICNLVFGVGWLSLLVSFCLPLLVMTLCYDNDIVLPARTKGWLTYPSSCW